MHTLYICTYIHVCIRALQIEEGYCLVQLILVVKQVTEFLPVQEKKYKAAKYAIIIKDTSRMSEVIHVFVRSQVNKKSYISEKRTSLE